MRRVVVTGLGAVTPLGVGVRETWRRLIAGESGVVSVAGREPRARWAGLGSTVAGVVPVDMPGTGDWGKTGEMASTARGPGTATTIETAGRAAAARGAGAGKTGVPRSTWRAGDWLSEAEQRRMPRFAHYAIAAADMALRDAGWGSGDVMLEGEEAREGMGVCLGSGIGNLEDMYDTSVGLESEGYKKVSPLFIPKILINMAAGHIAIKYGLQGPNHAATTACTTGAHSIGDAARIVAAGAADVMLAGGSESCIHPLAFAGFGRAKSLSTSFHAHPASSCRPFDASRDGFVIAEGAAVLVLEELGRARARGARIYAELGGYGASADAHHMTAPRGDGRGAYLAMRRALEGAGLRPREVDYVNAHATGTRIGDRAEAVAVGRLMVGEEGWGREGDVTVSSTKGAVGHLLGASGAIEALFSILAIHEGIVPATLNLEKPDVGLDFNFVPLEAQAKKVRVAMTNSFGFGGTNCSLVFRGLE